MNRQLLHLLLGAVLCGTASAYADEDTLPADSLRLLDAVEVSADRAMRTTLTADRPLAHTLVSPLQMKRYDMSDLTGLTGRVPSLYIPDYGSKRSTAIYLRGVGARSSGQTIGFYVDGVPYLNKSGFNFDLIGIKQVEVLRGPQGTLYGRNAMAGAINLYTVSAFDNDPGRAKLRLGDYRTLEASLLVNKRLGEAWGISAGLSLMRRDGYTPNVTTGARQDSLKSLNAFAKIEYRPSARFGVALSAHLDRVSQGGFPYRRVAASGEVLPLDAGDPATYARTGAQIGLNLKWQGDWYTFVSSTGYQHLSDRTRMDMDGSPLKGFHVEQRGLQNAVTQELVWRNAHASDRYQWSLGAFAFYDAGRLDVPVTLQTGGLRLLIQSQLDRLHKQNPRAPYMKIDASTDVLNPNYFEKPEWGVALYHEGTLRDLLVPGLSATLGLRLDYSRQQMRYDSSLALRLGVSTSGTTDGPFVWMSKPTHLVGLASSSSLQLLPKVALQYERDGWAVYASATKGFKAGGYNEQQVSDIIQMAQMQDLQSLSGRTPAYDASGLNDRLGYSPETAWNYELGARLETDGILQYASATVYYLDVRDLQLTRFVASGAGRVISNSGRSRSLGAELMARLRLADNLSAVVSYGYTDARFVKRTEAERAMGLSDLGGKFVPFVPRHTYSLLLSAYEPVHRGWVDSFYADVELSGLGRTYWTEDNAYSQPGYATLGGRLGIMLGRVDISIWGKNLLGSDHATFFFRSMGSSFTQLAAPRTVGVDLSIGL